MNETEVSFFEQLYTRYKRLMLSQAMHYCSSNIDEAEDVVHDTIVRLMDKYEVLSALDEKPLVTYIVYTVRSVAINRQKHINVENNYMKAYNEEALWSAEDQMFISLLPEDFFSGWAKLPVQDRDLLTFRYFLDLSVGELAQIYDCSAVRIRVRLYRARERAKRLLLGKERDKND